jgi:hypothetical protein
MNSATANLPLWIQIALAIVPALGLFFTAAGLFLNVAQSRKTNAQPRASMVASSLKGFADDKDMQAAFYLLEYEKFKFDEASFSESETERVVDKLLRHFSNLALAWQAGLLKRPDVMPIKYYLIRIMGNEGIEAYLRYLENWATSQQVNEHPYLVLERLYRVLKNDS